MAESIFGLVGVGSQQASAHPESWRSGIARWWPKGKAPLTALMSQTPSESVDQPKFHWHYQGPPKQGGNITAGQIFTDSDCQIAYGGGGTRGSSLWAANIPLDIVSELRIGHRVMFAQKALGLDNTRVVHVDGVVRDGATSKFAFHLVEDDSTTGGVDLRNADYAVVVGSAHADGAKTPSAITRQPESALNYIQDFRTSYYISDLAKARKTRYGMRLKRQQKKEKLYVHGQEQEMAAWFGVRDYEVDSNGQETYSTGGVLWFLKNYGGDEYRDDFRRNTSFKGAWLDKGKYWLNNFIKEYYRFQPDTDSVVGFCGCGALEGINNLAEMWGQHNLRTYQAAFGIQVTEWITVHGRLKLVEAPLWNLYGDLLENSIMFLGPHSIKFRPMEGLDTHFRDDCQEKGETAEKAEWRTVGGYEYGHPKSIMILTGVGQNSTL